MATKRKKRTKRRLNGDFLSQARRNLEKGNCRQALKDAKRCYRDQQNEEHRLILECSYMARAQELLRLGKRDLCRDTVENLLRLGVTEPSVESALPELLVSIGMFDQLRSIQPTSSGLDSANLRNQAADCAVVHPDEAPASVPQLRRDAERVRAAIQAITDGHESEGLRELAGIARNSPFADWKYFVRGLAAYYRDDADGMDANWGRLDTGRFAYRIAKPLRVTAGLDNDDPGDPRLQLALKKLERNASRGALRSRLDVLRKNVADGDWDAVYSKLRFVYDPLKSFDNRLSNRLVAWFTSKLINELPATAFDRLANVVDGPLLDPRWNRAKAMAIELDESVTSEDSVLYWRRYLDDLSSLPAFSSVERKLAQALVHHHLGVGLASVAHMLRNCRCGMDRQAEITEKEVRAFDSFEKCVRLAPTYATVYESWAIAHEMAGRPALAAETYHRALKHLPENIDALLRLAKYNMTMSPRTALEYAQRVKKLRPLDQDVNLLVRSAHIECARQAALESDFSRARHELHLAEKLSRQPRNGFDLVACKAVTELKAERPMASRSMIEEAVEQPVDPALLWFHMAIESVRHELPQDESLYQEKRWLDSLAKKKYRGPSAGHMCRILASHLVKDRPYDRCDAHGKSLLNYVKRCSRVRWTEQDLQSVCEFLDLLDKTDTLVKFAKIGAKKFPRSNYFHYTLGQTQLDLGQWKTEFKERERYLNRAKKHFDKVVELGCESTDAGDRDYFTKAQKALLRIEAVRNFWPMLYGKKEIATFGRSFGPGDMIHGRPIEEMLSAFQRVCDELDIDMDELLEDLESR